MRLGLILCTFAYLLALYGIAHAKNVPMPNQVALFVCKTVIAGEPDENAKFTGWEDREWATEHSMMICRREVIQVYDPSLDGGEAEDGTPIAPAAPQPFNEQRCMSAAIMLGVQWDQSHRGSSYRVWRVACPTPMVDTQTGDVVGWVIPDCGHRDIVTCLRDSVI